MKAIVAAWVLFGLVALAASSGISSAGSSSIGIGITSSVSFDRNYSDPASDVVKLWTVNMTPVLTPSGNLTMSPTPASVNLRWVRSANASENVTVGVEVVGEIANLDNTSYEVRLYTRSDNASHFIVTYVNGVTVLTSNGTGFLPKDISGNSTLSGPNPTQLNTLRINVAKSLLGTMSSWNIDGVATQRGQPYTHRDYGWEVPGNPGSSPTPAPQPSGLPSWLWIVVAAAIVTVLVAIVAAVRRKRGSHPP